MSNRYLVALNGNEGDELWWHTTHKGQSVRCYWRRNPLVHSKKKTEKSKVRHMTFAMFRVENTIGPNGYNEPKLTCITVYSFSTKIPSKKKKR